MSIVEERQLAKLVAALALDGEINVANVIGARHEANDAGNEKDDSLDAAHVGKTVDDDAAKY